MPFSTAGANNMVTDAARAGKILIYDGDCPMCRATIDRLLAWQLVQPEQTVSNHEVASAELEMALAAGLRNELVVLDTNTREMRRGADGLLWIIRDQTRYPALWAVLSLPGIRHLLRIGYRTISYNRRIISPPAHHVVCDCEPELTLGRRLALVVPGLIYSWALLACAGATLFAATGWNTPWSGATAFSAAVLAMAIVLVVASLVGMPAVKRLDYLGHMTVTLMAGSSVFVPIAVLAPFLPRGWAMAGFALSAGTSLVLSIAMQPRRVAAIGLAHGWAWLWLLASLASGVACLTTAALLR